MYPHERSLVKRLQGKPFALVGINSDRTFGPELTRLRADFTGRKWLDAELDHWLAQSGQRVLLITALSGLPRLTGELQRVLRVLGDEEPSVEVVPPRFDLPDYHRDALADSELVCVGAVGTGNRLVAA